MGQIGWLQARACLKLAAAFGAVFLVFSGLPAAAGMQTGNLTSQPIGHYEFCRSNPAECAIRIVEAGPLAMSGELWRKLVAINAAVNRSINPKSDLEVFGKVEVWSYPTAGVGDCEDYVLEKRKLLAESGLPLSNLLITVVRKPDNEGHAVLTVSTDKGDFVLDNLSDAVKSWDRTGYRFLKRQSSTDTGRWVAIREDQNVLVGALE